MTFRYREKERYRKLKPKLFSPEAQRAGNYRGRSRFFYLADDRHGGKHRGEDLYNALFFDPFYQLMRLQLLAQEMELSREMDADVVTVVLDTISCLKFIDVKSASSVNLGIG